MTMGREVINKVECAKCHKMFDVATEDLEWEKADTIEAKESKSRLRETHIMQKIECPHCKKENTIVYKEIGDSQSKDYTREVFSIESDILLKDIEQNK